MWWTKGVSLFIVLILVQCQSGEGFGLDFLEDIGDIVADVVSDVVGGIDASGGFEFDFSEGSATPGGDGDTFDPVEILAYGENFLTEVADTVNEVVSSLTPADLAQLPQNLLDSLSFDTELRDELSTVGDPIVPPSARRIEELARLVLGADFKTGVNREATRRRNGFRDTSASFRDTDREARRAGFNPVALNNRPSAGSNTVHTAVTTFQEIARVLGLTRGEIRWVYSLSRGNSRSDSNSQIIRILLEHFTGVDCPFRNSDLQCNPFDKFRSVDGGCNNLRNPTWGMANTAFRRFVFPRYADVFGKPFKGKTFSGRPQVSARTVSSTVNARVSRLDNTITHMVMQFGQFIDHDVTLAPDTLTEDGHEVPSCCAEDSPDSANLPPAVRARIQEGLNRREECNHIPLEPNDPNFAPRRCMSQVRSQTAPVDNCQIGIREQVNAITSYVDGSMIYGSDEATAGRLRSKRGGLLHTQSGSSGALLPLAAEQESCIHDPGTRGRCFEAGDTRVNEHPGLASIHTMFVREHNRIATELSRINSHWDDETLYQETRKIVAGIIQHILYGEDLKILLGNEYRNFDLEPERAGRFYLQYDPKVDGSMRNGFATSAYRFGHTLIRDEFSRVGTNGRSIPGAGPLKLRNEFFNPATMYQRAGDGPDSILRGLVHDKAEGHDRFVSSEIADHLFETFTSHPRDALDLLALNVQRGRDHGLDSYVAFRRAFDLSVPRNFDDLVDHDASARESLRKVYSRVEDIEVFPGGISETAVEGGVLGPLFARMIGRQFELTKRGDRYFYENRNEATGFTIEQLDEIRKVSMSRIMCNNVDINRIQRNAFRTVTPRNPEVRCSDILSINLEQWRTCVGTGPADWSQWSRWTPCCRGFRSRIRECDSRNSCGSVCRGRNRQNSSCSCGTNKRCSIGCSRVRALTTNTG